MGSAGDRDSVVGVRSTRNGVPSDADPKSTSGTGNAALSVVPRHVAFIMDGNGRWARQRLFERIEGHRAGTKTVRMVIEESRKLGVRYLSLFAFSTENWKRPGKEVGALMALFERYLISELNLMLENGIRLRMVGDFDRLPSAVKDSLSRAMEKTSHCKEMDLILAVSYGGREELVHAMRELAQRVSQGELKPEDIDEQTLRSHLYAPDVPDPDLLIRTSDESRISNFYLWQLAYSEIVVTSTLWPDFSKDDYLVCLREFAGRTRRYGMTDDQIANLESAPSVEPAVQYRT